MERRILDVSVVRQAVAQLVVQANCCIGEGMISCLEQCRDREEKALSRNVLDMIVRNDRLAEERMVAMCQDTGMAIFRVQVGQDICFTGGSLEQAIQDGTAQGYTLTHQTEAGVGFYAAQFNKVYAGCLQGMYHGIVQAAAFDAAATVMQQQLFAFTLQQVAYVLVFTVPEDIARLVVVGKIIHV